MEIFDNPIFMTNEDINMKYEGKWVLINTKSKEDGIFVGGNVMMVAEDTDENESLLYDILKADLKGNGYVHYAHIDRGEGLNVSFGAIR